MPQKSDGPTRPRLTRGAKSRDHDNIVKALEALSRLDDEYLSLELVALGYAFEGKVIGDIDLSDLIAELFALSPYCREIGVSRGRTSSQGAWTVKVAWRDLEAEIVGADPVRLVACLWAALAQDLPRTLH
jgi:hypothetical protein